MESADLKIRISRKVLNILTRKFEHIFIYTYFIYSVHYLVVWEHIFLTLERRLTIFLWLSLLWIHIKTMVFYGHVGPFWKEKLMYLQKECITKDIKPKIILIINQIQR